MGCTTSTNRAPVSRNTSNRNLQPLSEKEIQARIEAPKESQMVTIGGIIYKCAWVSQRGYYPDSPNKDNQDAFTVQTSFGSANQGFLGVFDGHGKEGHHCARYVRDNLPKKVLANLERIQEPSHKNIKQALSVSHLTVNEELHGDITIDDTLSGTTSITVLIRDKTLFVSNVGDSRAIVASVNADGRVVAKPMSSDQTPYRKDERERVKKYGARILSMDQIEGLEAVHENWGDVNLGEDIDEGGDPPRIWSPHGDYPGTAFTRSFGDKLAEDLGVTAEAEILVRDVDPSDRIIIIASDGVFEFLTNQMVTDIACRSTDPLEACYAIVNSAYNLWLQYEIRTDDISIIALYIDEYAGVPSTPLTLNSIGVTTSPGRTPSSPKMEERPVRRTMSREKRKHIILAQDEEKLDNTIESTEDNSLRFEKSDAERAAIEDAIRNNFLFQHLNHSQRQYVIDYMQPLRVKKGDWVIHQGDKGDRFYVVDSGSYEVRVNSSGSVDSSGGPVVHVYTGTVDQHPGFGELSLMYGKPRAASVIAITDGRLWALDRNVFRTLVMRSTDARKGIIRTLKKVELLRCLTTQQMQRLADLLVEESFPADHYIIRQGEVGDNFYLIVKGECDCTVSTGDGESKLVLQLKDNDYFGEKALLTSNPRAANVITKTPTKVMSINKKAFEEVLGPLSAIIDQDRARREMQGRMEIASKGAQIKSINDITILGVVQPDNTCPMLLGSFGNVLNNSSDAMTANVTIRSFVLSAADSQGISDSVINSIEAAQVITSALIESSKAFLVPRLRTVLKDNNAFHMVHDVAVVCDLFTIVLGTDGHETKVSTNTGDVSLNVPPQQQPLRQDVVAYIAACLVAGLETLHSLGIVYRAVQPESIHVDIKGTIVLMDYRMSKIGLDPVNGKTFTICGCADYLSPEQISQKGHGMAVDLWALGTLLYELAVGIHPFSSHSEVATYSKISSFGSKSFPSLTFPEYVSSEIKSIVNQLLVPRPEARLGAGVGGFDVLKKHALFRGMDWKSMETMKSPLQTLAMSEYEELRQYEVDPKLINSFGEEYVTRSGWEKSVDYS